MITTLIASLVLSVPAVDVKVDGEGYLRFAREGRIVYAKSAKLTVSQGKLTALTGESVMPTMVIPEDTISLEITLDGTVLAISKSKSKYQAGQFVLGYFENANQVHTDGAFLVSSIRPKLVTPGDQLAGVIRVGAAESKVVIPPKAQPTEPPIPVQKATPVTRSKTIEKKALPKPKNVTPGSVRIDVKLETMVSANTYTVGDIAEVTADADLVEKIKEVPMGTSPLIGIQCPIDKYRLISRLRLAGFEPAKWVINLTAGSTVVRESQKVAQEQFVECATNYGKSLVPSGLGFSSIGAEREFFAPLGALELKCERFNMGTNSATATVAVFVDGRRINSRLVKLNVTGSNGEAVVRIASGTRVKIVFRSNGAIVEVQGRTSSSALIGQTVQVISDRRTSHTGVLVNPGVVEVKL
jgi:hypothetical protein